MNIIIFYQHISRELKACKMLKEKLENTYSANVKIFSIDFEYFAALKYNKKVAADIILMPWVHNDDNYFYLVPFVEANENLIAINLHHEQVGTPVSETLIIPRGHFAKDCVYHFVWGDFFAERLVKNDVSPDIIRVCGNMRLDIAAKKEKDRSDLAKEFNLDVNKRWCLFCENRDSVLSYNESVESFFISNGYSDSDAKGQFKMLSISLNNAYDDIDNIESSFFEQNEFIYRSHPGTILNKKFDSHIKVSSKYSIYQWLHNVDIYLTSSSTSMFEADALSIPSFIWDNTEISPQFVPKWVEDYTKIEKLTDLTDEMIKLAVEKSKKEKTYERYIGKCDNHNIERISEEIANIFKNKENNVCTMETVKIPKEFFKEKRLYEKVTKIVAKLRLLEKLKFPKSAYREKNDIPYYKNNINRYL